MAEVSLWIGGEGSVNVLPRKGDGSKIDPVPSSPPPMCVVGAGAGAGRVLAWLADLSIGLGLGYLQGLGSLTKETQTNKNEPDGENR